MKEKTLKPDAALSRLVLLAFLGIILLAGEMIAAGVAGDSWLLITAGSVMLVGGLATTLQARQGVRIGLSSSSGKGASSS